jgi:hypothetical protein
VPQCRVHTNLRDVPNEHRRPIGVIAQDDVRDPSRWSKLTPTA